MYYEEQQGIAYAVGKIENLLDSYYTAEVIPKDEIMEVIEELRKEYQR